MEVLVALAIFALAAIILSQSFLNGLLCRQAFEGDKHVQHTRWIRRQILAEKNKEILERGVTLPLYDGAKAEVSVFLTETSVLDCFSLVWKAEVSYGEMEAHAELPYALGETCYVFRPKWTSATERGHKLREKRVQLGRPETSS